MNYCPKCDIVIRGNKACCPLCQGKPGKAPDGIYLWESAGVEAFPVVERKISSVTFMKLATFLFLTLEICFGAVRGLIGWDKTWVHLVMLGILVGWVDVLIVMYLRSNIIKLLTVEVYVAIVIDIYVDYMTHMHGWSLAWVMPFALIGLGIATAIIALATGLRPSEYVQYIALNALFSLLQIIPIRMGLNPITIPAVSCIACYLIYMAAVVVFLSKDLKTALSRRFNLL